MALETGDNRGGESPVRNFLLRGHQQAEQEFLAAWRSARLHHAWLITGKRGIGKATMAYKIARFILQEGGSPQKGTIPDGLDLSPQNPVCKRVAAGAHADLKVLQQQWDDKKKRRKTDIVVDDVRRMGDFLSMTSGEGGWRVVVVDAADQMNRNAANAILKLLEEPPKQSLFLLLAHNPAQLLPTLRSRCRTLVLRPLSDEIVFSLLQTYLPEIGDDERISLTRMGQGSIGRALDVQAGGGLSQYRSMVALLRRLPHLDGVALHAFADQSLKGEDGFRVTTDLLVWWLGRTVAAGGRGDAPPEIIPGENALVKTLMVSAPLDQWVQVWEKMNRLFKRCESVNLDKKQVLISAFGMVDRLVRPH